MQTGLAGRNLEVIDITQILPPLAMAFTAGIIVAGCIVQSGLGMGFGLTVAPLLALIDPVLVPAPTLILGMFTASWGAFTDRGIIQWHEVATATAGRFAGVIAGLVMLFWLSGATGFNLLFGTMVLIAVILSVAGRSLPFNRLSLGAMGVISGVMGTITSVGAPPLALVYHGRNPSQSRATLSAFFAIGCAVSLAGLFVSGLAGLRDLYLALVMAPPMVIGLWLAHRLRLGFAKWYRPWLLAVSGVAGVILIVRGLS